MIVVTLQRDKCIGCNYCAELAPAAFRMSRRDGKSVLLRSVRKKGFYTWKSTDDASCQSLEKAADSCPVRIIRVKRV